jgi:insulysin
LPSIKLRPCQRRTWLTLPWLTLLAVLLAAGCTAVPDSPEIRQSPNDDRQYRFLTLANGLDVVLIEDPEADMAAASLSVYRGSHDDPDEREGMAHYLEHMLFLGTEKYPDVDAYGSFIARHGGRHNAYTAADHTNYFFDIQPEYLEGALDRFAQFFIAPRFDPDYAEREKHAVHSEYQMQLRNDAWRGFAVRKQIMNPEHPGSRFNIGSLETLSGDIRDELLQFFRDHHSADEMGLVLIGPQSLRQLEPGPGNSSATLSAGKRCPPPILPHCSPKALCPRPCAIGACVTTSC